MHSTGFTDTGCGVMECRSIDHMTYDMEKMASSSSSSASPALISNSAVQKDRGKPDPSI